MLNQIITKKKKVKYKNRRFGFKKILNLASKYQNQNIKRLYISIILQDLKSAKNNI